MNYSKLRERIQGIYGAPETFAKRIRQTPENIEKKLAGAKPITRGDVIKWSDALLIQPDEIAVYFFT